ncbi:hypothetical protein HDC90_003229 [Pedobacter sp. AK013]|nr:hypothetical protein [Pedobacter sp. AK013]
MAETVFVNYEKRHCEKAFSADEAILKHTPVIMVVRLLRASAMTTDLFKSVIGSAMKYLV